MNVLDKIIARKKEEVAHKRKAISLQELTRLPAFQNPTVSLAKSLKAGNGIIAEFKRKSPSAGKFHDLQLEEVLRNYNRQKVSGYSILTDEEGFGGEVVDLQLAKSIASGPVLRKEFIIDEYQIFEAKAYGADAILMIAAALDEYHATYLTTIAQSIGLEVLMEFHSTAELNKLNENIDIIGVNNRDLRSLETALSHSEDLIKHLPYNAVKIAESGIKHPVDIEYLYGLGYEGCLIGEAILKDPNLLKQLTQTAERSKTIIYEN